MTTTLDRRIHFRTNRRRHIVAPGAAPEVPAGRVPRVARLMALAIRLDGMVRSGEVASYSELGALGHVTRARITQIMNLLNLAPDIQEAILDLPLIERGRDPPCSQLSSYEFSLVLVIEVADCHELGGLRSRSVALSEPDWPTNFEAGIRPKRKGERSL